MNAHTAGESVQKILGSQLPCAFGKLHIREVGSILMYFVQPAVRKKIAFGLQIFQFVE